MFKIEEYPEMPVHAETTRRDLRFKVRRGVGFVEFHIDRPQRGDLTSVSAAGLTFEINADDDMKEGMAVQAATVLIGECAIEGDLAVRHVRPVNESRIEAGCMFYPSSHTGVEKWSAAVAVIEAVGED
jgi:hypothetical protein